MRSPTTALTYLTVLFAPYAVILFHLASLSSWTHGALFQYDQIYVLLALLVLLELCLLATRFKALFFVFLAAVALITAAFFASDLSAQIAFLVIIVTGGVATGNRLLLKSAILLYGIWIFRTYDMLALLPYRFPSAEFVLLSTLLAWFALVAVVASWVMDYRIKAQAANKRIDYCESTIQQLSDANIGYSTFAQHARYQALIEERNRITREIHDDVGYTLTNIIMLSETCLTAVQSGNVPDVESILAIKQQAKTGLYETRRALRLLRQTESKLPRGVDSLRQLIQVYQKATGVVASINLLARRERIEDQTLFLTIYRFIQESLTNSFRHGKASEVSVRVFEDGNWLYVTVSDNGKGSGIIKEGIGLQGMRERISFLGGEIRYYNNNGFTITASIPTREV